MAACGYKPFENQLAQDYVALRERQAVAKP